MFFHPEAISIRYYCTFNELKILGIAPYLNVKFILFTEGKKIVQIYTVKVPINIYIYTHSASSLHSHPIIFNNISKLCIRLLKL